jgi:ubiquitin-like domain-containing CTD phosphatase 1
MFKLSTGYVKPLHIIWSKCPDKWDRKNTIHVDDLERNFALNPESGVLISPFHRSKGEVQSEKSDSELVYLAKYLVLIHQSIDLSTLNHKYWRENK